MEEQQLKKALLKWAATTPESIFIPPKKFKKVWREWKDKPMEDVVEIISDEIQHNEVLVEDATKNERNIK